MNVDKRTGIIFHLLSKKRHLKGKVGMTQKQNKSQRNIINAFFLLRARKSLERISVKEVCEIADVNKSTFYVYYRDIYDLSFSLQKEVIDRITETLPSLSAVVEDQYQFTKDVLLAYEANKVQISTLFSGSQVYQLPALVKEKLLEILEEMPTTVNEERLRMVIDYKVYGSFFAFMESTTMNQADKIEFISRLAGEKKIS